jgi:hypothetical protein
MGSLQQALLMAGAGAGAGTQPNAIADLEMWLDATTLGLADGAAVATWTDSSGNSRPGTGVNSPTYQTNEINGLGVVRFDVASSQYFTLPNFLSGVFTEGEVFFVLKAVSDAPAASRTLHTLCGGGVQGQYPNGLGQINDPFGHTAALANNPAPALTAWRLYNFNASAAGRAMRLDGAVLTSDGTASGSSWTTTPRIGNRSGSTQYFDGDIAEVILYSRVLTSGERDGIEAYVAAKFALTIP